MSNCFFISRRVNGGGNIPVARPIIIRRTGAIGDALCATIVADKILDAGLEVTFQSHPHCHCVLRLKPRLHSVEVPNGHCDVNLDGTYEKDPGRRHKHFHEMFLHAANQQLANFGGRFEARNCKPRLRKPLNSIEAMTQQLRQYPRPWVFVCPRSNSYNVRQVPDGIWSDAAKAIDGTKFWLGTHPGPANIVDLGVRHFDTVLAYLSVADLLISVDTGPLHVAAAFGIPIVAINQSSSPEWHLNDQNDFITIQPPGLDCLDCQKNVCPKNQHMPPCQQIPPELIAEAANRKLRGMVNDVSAVVAIYQPESPTLNRCLECLLPQVQEIVVTAEANSVVPPDALKNAKIRYVRKNQRAIGYGRNCNFGARHTNGKFLLLINDDVFLDPGAVEALRKEMTDGVGVVSHHLRYPSGQIYHAGKVRSPGQMGWAHIDHRKYETTFKGPVDQENTCGASILVRREAFYRIDGFDEDYFLYCEDDDFMLRMRHKGWKIRYTPHATGIHMEGQSTRKVGNPMNLVQTANKTFDTKWGWYLRKNAQTIPGTFE